MNILEAKFKEVFSSVIPIVLIVLILNFTLTPMEMPMLIRFVLGAILVIIGLTIFLIGVDRGITPIGNYMGETIAKSDKLYTVVLLGLFLGFFVSIAEPDLHILAGQVSAISGGQINKTLIIVVVSVGIAIMLTVGLLRIAYKIAINKVLTIVYGIIFVLSFFTTEEFLAISFDASGATTGALTVPFMLALAVGVSRRRVDSVSSEEDSFGLVGLASSGVIVAVMLMNVLYKQGDIVGEGNLVLNEDVRILKAFTDAFPTILMEVSIALLPILIIFLIGNKRSFKLSKREFRLVLIGILFTFVGLILFLLGVNAGFMDAGTIIGKKLASFDNKAYLIVISFIIGMATILAEPAVYVLTHQIEDVTSGYVKRSIVLGALAIGVAIAVALFVLKIIIPELKLWYYLLPGYLISIALSYKVPSLFVGMAFDSGGVASGPMTATFILAFASGVSAATEGSNIMLDGFGIIAMVAMTPLIALQVLGYIYKKKSKKEAIDD
ncbi:hypothetical protein ING2D1G_1014 [Peptoniphilus sp. ING2-D1G]|nr:hypothetical protein ING2D1G_1014 [Peptoniphilus sp. ING2-D1G]